MISDPLHRLDCCVVSDGGGAVIVARPEIAKSLKRRWSRSSAPARATKHQMGGKIDLTYTGAAWTGPRAFEEAGVKPSRHQVRVDLRQLHDHGPAADRRPRLLQERRRREVRRRRQPHLGHRQVAVQYRRRRSLQQPPGEPRRHDQDHRSGAPASRRSRTPRCRSRTAISRSRTAPAARIGHRHGSATLIMERE